MNCRTESDARLPGQGFVINLLSLDPTFDSLVASRNLEEANACLISSGSRSVAAGGGTLEAAYV
jgi:hypothetical protein